jgi:hypothetical protein
LESVINQRTAVANFFHNDLPENVDKTGKVVDKVARVAVVVNIPDPTDILVGGGTVAAGAGAIYTINRIDNAHAATKDGRLGNTETRDQVKKIANEYRDQDYRIIGGGGVRKEEYLPGPGGKRKGSNYVDLTVQKDDEVIRINTVDTLKDGITPTARERRAANKIRSKIGEGEELLLIPKAK